MLRYFLATLSDHHKPMDGFMLLVVLSWAIVLGTVAGALGLAIGVVAYLNDPD